MVDDIRMNQQVKLLAVTVLLTALVGLVPSAVADHETGHYSVTLPQNYYDYLPLVDASGAGVEVQITASESIDFMLMTEAQFQACCSGEFLDAYEWMDEESEFGVDDYTLILQNGEEQRYLVIDNTDEPSGGTDAVSSVEVDIYLFELPENYFSFNWENLAMFLIFLPLLVLICVEALQPGSMQNFRRHPSVDNVIRVVQDGRLSVTYGLIAFCTVAFVLRFLLTPAGDTYTEWLEFGAMTSGSVFNGNLFLLVSANFFHFDIYHLAGNMFALFILGRYLEPKYGAIRFSGLLLIGGVGSSILAMFYDPIIASGGASGMVFACFGIVLSEFVLDWKKGTKHVYCQWYDMQWYWGALLLNGMTSFQPGVSLLGHLGGFLAGIGAIALMIRFGTHPKPRSDQLIHCKACGFTMPVADISEVDVTSCMLCGAPLNEEE